MTDAEVLELFDETRSAWGAEGPRPVGTHVWRPVGESTGRPLVVLSHGSGGAAVNLAWLAEALCAEGFLVAAVDHHRNTYFDNQHLEGFSFWWERAPDLSFVVDHLAASDGVERAAVVGYSLGGFTAACVLGARIDTGKLARLYSGEPILPIPPDRPDIAADYAELFAKYGREALEARALADYRDPRFVAGVLLAPAICPILDDATLAAIDRPVYVRWGDADEVEAPEDNGARYTRLIPGADGRSLGEHVGHFEFGGETEGGEPVRATVLSEVLPFFRKHLGSAQR
jgi:predicted dienelactone hydrolase